MIKIISIIPARGGSKRIIKKNIKIILNKPLIQYTIEQSLRSKYISETFVSTDDEIIAKKSIKLGAKVPFLRPAEFSTDSSTDYDVIINFLENFLKIYNTYPLYIVYLRPTMPLRKTDHIDRAFKLINKEDIDCVRTVRKTPYTPYWMKKISNKGLISTFSSSLKSYENIIRQKLPEVYICDGYVDIFKVSSLLNNKTFPPKKQMALKIDDVPYLDIDTMDDFELCKYYLKNSE